MKKTSAEQNVQTGKSDISLRPLLNKDYNLIKKWYKDPRVIRYILPEKEISSILERFIHKYFKSWIIARLFGYWLEHGHGFFILHQGQPIGVIVCWLIDKTNGTYRLPVTIGLPEYWGKGYGRKAILQAADFIFNQLDGKRIIAGDVHMDNIRSRKMFESCGFRELSRQEADYYRELSIPNKTRVRIREDINMNKTDDTVSFMLRKEDFQSGNRNENC